MRVLTIPFFTLLVGLLGCSSTHETSPGTIVQPATKYDRSCAVDDDCMLVLQGNRCDCECPSAAIAKTARPRYEADRAALPACTLGVCDVECTPTPAAACVGGQCEERSLPDAGASDGG
jgi:hypothetical protein